MMAPRSSREEDPGLEADPQVFVEADAEAVLPLGLAEAREDAHLGLVLGAGADLRRGVDGELAIARGAVGERREARAHPRREAQRLRRAGAIRHLRLAAIAARRAGAGRHVAEAHAPLLPPLGGDGREEDAVLDRKSVV